MASGTEMEQKCIINRWNEEVMAKCAGGGHAECTEEQKLRWCGLIYRREEGLVLRRGRAIWKWRSKGDQLEDLETVYGLRHDKGEHHRRKNMVIVNKSGKDVQPP